MNDPERPSTTGNEHQKYQFINDFERPLITMQSVKDPVIPKDPITAKDA